MAIFLNFFLSQVLTYKLSGKSEEAKIWTEKLKSHLQSTGLSKKEKVKISFFGYSPIRLDLSQERILVKLNSRDSAKMKTPQSRDKFSSQQIPEEEKSDFYEAAAKHFKVCDQLLHNSNVYFKILNDQLLQKTAM